MKKIIIVAIALLCALSLQAQGDLHLISVENKDGAVTPLMIEDALVANGFAVDLNSEMNLPFNKQFKETSFKVFTLMTFHHNTLALELVKKYPQAGVLTPMGIGIYQSKNEDTLHISVLTAEAQGKILDIETSILKKIEAELLAVFKKSFPKAKFAYSEDSLKESRQLVTRYEMDLDGEDWEDAKEEFEMTLEGEFEPFGFVMPSFLDLNEELTQEGTVDSPYDFYDTYSICKLKVIYTVAKSRPEASAFAPCTTMVYKKKDEDKIVIGFPAVYNWLSSTKIKDKEAQAVLMKAQTDFESILIGLTE
ncbi:DUF302 domain-containing protein [Sulfurimonas sp. SAG-AH-194-L11]|nr:DUF302 domain-containing protein [Sulfurimonas sp. SAG-AH-194-L11]MDF1876929.1 DUF302 domain-containing protein [Sulfurimonas sp. SAG-AH-194-L11]